MTTEAFGKVHGNKSGFLIYIPLVLARDSQFPLKANDKIRMAAMGKRLEITKIKEMEGDSDE